jgi:hypothetical protein
MTETEIRLAVIMERRILTGKWAGLQWEAIGVVPDAAGETAPRALRQDGTNAQWLFPGQVLRLFRDEADNYLLNVCAPEPRVFVMWRLPEESGEDALPQPKVLTASYGEAARFLDSGEQVDGVPMPPELRAWIDAFAQRHYRPPEKKAKRFASSREAKARGA